MTASTPDLSVSGWCCLLGRGLDALRRGCEQGQTSPTAGEVTRRIAAVIVAVCASHGSSTMKAPGRRSAPAPRLVGKSRPACGAIHAPPATESGAPPSLRVHLRHKGLGLHGLARLLLSVVCAAHFGGRGSSAFVVPVLVNQVDGSAECTAALAGRRAYPIVRGACMSTPAAPCLARRQATGGSLAWLCAAAPRAVALLRRGGLAARPGAAAHTVLRQTRGDAGDAEGDVKPERRGGRIGSGSIPSNVQPSGGPNLRAMYLGSALSGFADRMWEFSIPFFTDLAKNPMKSSTRLYPWELGKIAFANADWREALKQFESSWAHIDQKNRPYRAR